MEMSVINVFVKFINYIFHSNIINFALMMWLFSWIFKKYNLINLLNNAVLKVKESIETSNYEMHKSEALLEDSLKSLEHVDSEIDNIRQKSKERGDILKKRIELSSKSQLERIKTNYAKIISVEEQNISNDLKNYTIEKSLELAKNKLLNSLKENSSLHEKYIEQSIDEFERMVV